mmetsp:Transcript_27293/g.45501  ORF Transcript_27293/g.45501 Transcript_27293/m.45501 type:complete len:104 (-) Transcript_27293:208-519(-)
MAGVWAMFEYSVAASMYLVKPRGSGYLLCLEGAGCLCVWRAEMNIGVALSGRGKATRGCADTGLGRNLVVCGMGNSITVAGALTARSVHATTGVATVADPRSC